MIYRLAMLVILLAVVPIVAYGEDDNGFTLGVSFNGWRIDGTGLQNGRPLDITQKWGDSLVMTVLG